MSLLAKSFQYAFEHHIPIMATIELTQNCNLGCRHCYNFDRTTYTRPVHDERENISKQDVLENLEELAKLGTLIVNFSGGEASLDKNLIDYFKKCRELKMEPRLKTNMAAITPSKLQTLIDAGFLA